MMMRHYLFVSDDDILSISFSFWWCTSISFWRSPKSSNDDLMMIYLMMPHYLYLSAFDDGSRSLKISWQLLIPWWVTVNSFWWWMTHHDSSSDDSSRLILWWLILLLLLWISKPIHESLGLLPVGRAGHPHHSLRCWALAVFSSLKVDFHKKNPQVPSSATDLNSKKNFKTNSGPFWECHTCSTVLKPILKTFLLNPLEPRVQKNKIRQFNFKLSFNGLIRKGSSLSRYSL